MKRSSLIAATTALLLHVAGRAQGPAGHLVCVSNERSGTVTILRDGERPVTIPVGKRPRGIHAAPDGSRLFVTLSGSPIGGAPQLDAKGNPILKEEEDEENSDHSADGIGVIDLKTRKFLGKLPAGSDPEEFAVSKDGRTL